MTDALSGGVAIRAAYLLVFGGSALVCFAGLRRTDRIAHDDTRRGLRWLLLTSGAWGLAHVGYLVAPTPGLAYALFVAGLVVGMAAVGPWLYFCSAYTGRSLHKNAGIRRFAVGTFLAVVLLKVTNPIHGAYFAAEAVAEPFAYLAIEHGPLHWAAMGLAYALSFVGFFALFELFLRVNSDTRPLFALVGLTGLPVVLDVLGAVSPRLLNVTHSPLGVAAFAVGVLFVHLDRFRIARAAGEGDDPVIVLDDTDRVRDYNAGAVELLPSLAGRVGAAFDEVLPEIDAALEEPDPVVELDRDGTTRYYTISSGAFSMDRARTGRTIILTDVTDRERYRQRLERQNEQLERFASIVSHDLRNPLSVARGWTELAIEEEDTRELGNVVDAHNRMGEIIEEILTLAREGNPIDEREDVHLAAVADRSWAMTTSGDASLVVEDGGSFPIDADPERLQQLFENLFRNALEHGAADGGDGDGGDGADDLTVTVGVLPDRRGFFVEDDGVGIPPDAREAVFEPAYTTAADGTGFGLAIVGEIVEAHGWTIRVVEGRDGGARFEITLGGDDSGDRPDESDDPFDGPKA